MSLLVSLFANQFNPYWLFISYDIGINIILAVSLNLINGYTGHFRSATRVSWPSAPTRRRSSRINLAQLNPIVCRCGFSRRLLAGGLAAALGGLLVGIPTLRLRGDYLAIVTLGFGEIIRVIFQNMNAVGGARGLSVMHGWTNFFWAFGFAAVTVYVVTALVNSTYGRGFIAVHDDEVAAAAMGINPTKYKVTAFVIGAFFAGIAGGLYAHSKQFITPGGFDFMQSIDIRRDGHPRRHGQHRRRDCRGRSADAAAGISAACDIADIFLLLPELRAASQLKTRMIIYSHCC